MTSARTGASFRTPRTVASAASATRAARPGARRHLQHFLRRVGGQHPVPRQFRHQRRQPVELHLRAAGMQVERALPQLADLAEPAADRHPVHRVRAEVFEQASGEIPHVQHRFQRQSVMGANRIFRSRSGAARHVAEPHGAGHIDAAMDGGNPRRAGERVHDARGAEDGKPADDAEPRVPRLLRQRFAARNGNLDFGRRAAQLRDGRASSSGGAPG